MSWAETFNSSAAGKRISREMPNIKLDSTISQAEIDAKIKEHEKNNQKGQDTSEKKSDNAAELNTATQNAQNNGYNNNQYSQTTVSAGSNYPQSQMQTAAADYSYGYNPRFQSVNSAAAQYVTAPLYPNYNQYQGYAECQPNIKQYQQYQGSQAPEQYAQTQSIQIPDYAIEAYKGTAQN
ncbi:MAG: hypothetical protein LUE64_00790 [Candidatus Gastranaerophilales bacterium]|nr:hypothetical protein [Candidatus Gastranaerophilales bacterium]